MNGSGTTRSVGPAVVPVLALLVALTAAGAAFPAVAAEAAPQAPPPPPQEEPKPAVASPEEPDKEKEEKKSEAKEASVFYEVTVTATRTPQDVFDVPNPVSVINRIEIDRRMPETATDLLFGLPGVDVNGVGPQQPRPIIRGQRGQRILVMEDGIRMNNPRRQSDFGELPSLVDTNGVERVEIVRGPGSVLYGSDAIGGVMNIITTRPPSLDLGSQFGGAVGFRYGTAGSLDAAAVNLNGREGRFGWLVRGFWRQADDYDAPAGSYGEITLDGRTPVLLSGVEDQSLTLRFDYAVGATGTLFFGAEFYRAQDAGFGYVNPADYNPGDVTIQLYYPDQNFDQYRAGYSATGLDWALMDNVSLTAYYRDNQRLFNQNIIIPNISPRFPDATLTIANRSDTDVTTIGARAEATKVAASWSVLTYGIDFYNDHSENSDFSKTSLSGFPFPIPPSTDSTPSLPYAYYRSFGVFMQDDLRLWNRFSAILGARYQTTWARTEPTPGLEDEPLYDSQDDAVVWATNFVFEATDYLNVVATVGTAFRSPNLIERFFNGLTPEGSGFQVRNPNLQPEESFNIDLGVKYRRNNVYFELGAFRNRIRNGIRIVGPLGTIDIEGEEFGIYQNQNIEELVYEGIEAALDWAITPAITVGLNYTTLDSKNETSSQNFAVAEGYSSKLNLMGRYQDPKDRFWVELDVRHQGDQTDIDPEDLVDNPVGSVFPAFTVANLIGGVTLFRSAEMAHKLNLQANNLTNELYAEFSNISFFRPEPERNYVLQYLFQF